MNKTLGLSIMAAMVPVCQAGDIDAGRGRVATVCAACHGATGVSVSETIPNLAGQRAAYVEAQLNALKESTRKNPIMNAIAAQLSSEDIANVAAYFASQPGAPSGARSEFLPNVAKSHVSFPEDYKDTFTKYQTINFPAARLVRYYFANRAAVQASREGTPLPEGSVLLSEVYAAKLDADKKPVTGSDGFFVADRLVSYAVRARGAGWGEDIPEMLRNGDWNYAVFTPDKQHKPGVNQAECLACHKPLDSASYTFTLKELAAVK
jgi:cytochrome c553